MRESMCYQTNNAQKLKLNAKKTESTFMVYGIGLSNSLTYFYREILTVKISNKYSFVWIRIYFEPARHVYNKRIYRARTSTMKRSNDDVICPVLFLAVLLPLKMIHIVFICLFVACCCLKAT